MAPPRARLELDERLEALHRERQARVRLQRAHDVRSASASASASRHTRASVSCPTGKAQRDKETDLKTYMTVLSASGFSLVRSAAQMSASGRSRVCHRLYARMCCGRGRSPGWGWVDCVLVVGVAEAVVWLEEVLLMLAPEEEGGRANGFQPAEVVLVSCLCGSGCSCVCICVCVGAGVGVNVGVEASSSGSLSSAGASAAGDEAVGAAAAALALAAVLSR